jgi:hypothetical protein
VTWDCYTNTKPVARKAYACDACADLNADLCEEDYAPDEWKLFEIARAEGFKILKGTQYDKTSGFWDGEPAVFRARPEMNAICVRHELYVN